MLLIRLRRTGLPVQQLTGLYGQAYWCPASYDEPDPDHGPHKAPV